MDKSIRDYFHEFEGGGSQTGHYHNVLALHDSHNWDWSELSKMVPNLPRGWYELSQLNSNDRIEFTRDHWIAKLPFHPHLLERIEHFFERLDDIGIFVTRHTEIDEGYSVHFVYSIANDGGFFHGLPPATDEEIATTQAAFEGTILPKDYIAFCQIHNGFKKYSDTGITKIQHIPAIYLHLQNHLAEQNPLYLKTGDQLNAKTLIPFYESFGCHCYQCFWSDWFAEGEIGNIYYSGLDHTLSQPGAVDEAELNMAFPTFLSWLVFYLEGID